MEYIAVTKDLYLSHHGVKGMKWGVRKDSKAPSSFSNSVKKRVRIFKKKVNVIKKTNDTRKADKVKAKKEAKSKREENSKLRRKSVKNMSDQELSTAIKRLEMEKKYKDMNNAAVSAGRKFLTDNATAILNSTVKNVGTQVATAVVGRAVNEVFKDQFPEGIVKTGKKS